MLRHLLLSAFLLLGINITEVQSISILTTEKEHLAFLTLTSAVLTTGLHYSSFSETSSTETKDASHAHQNNQHLLLPFLHREWQKVTSMFPTKIQHS